MRDQPRPAYSCQFLGLGLQSQVANKGWICLAILDSDYGLCHYLGVTCASHETLTDIMFEPTDRQLELLARGVRANAVFERQRARGRKDESSKLAYDLAHDSLQWLIAPAAVEEARDIVYAREVCCSPLLVEASYQLPGMNRANSLKRHQAEKKAQRKADYDVLPPGGWRQ